MVLQQISQERHAENSKIRAAKIGAKATLDPGRPDLE